MFKFPTLFFFWFFFFLFFQQQTHFSWQAPESHTEVLNGSRCGKSIPVYPSKNLMPWPSTASPIANTTLCAVVPTDTTPRTRAFSLQGHRACRHCLTEAMILSDLSHKSFPFKYCYVKNESFTRASKTLPIAHKKPHQAPRWDPIS